MKRKNFHLTGQQIERLEYLAQKTGLTVAEHIRRAIDAYLKPHETSAQNQTQPNA